MTGMILAAGFGTRLGKLTQAVPKPLVPVSGRPMLDHAVERLMKAGCTRIVVNAHHFADRLEEHVREAEYSVPIVLLREEEILGTGGAILNAEQVIGRQREFLVHNADIASDCDLASLLHRQRCGDGLATLLVQPRRTRRALLIGQDGKLYGKESWFADAPSSATTLRVGFCGIHAISSELFRLGLRIEMSDIFDLYREAMKRGHRIDTMTCDGYWTDLGTEDRIHAHETWLASRA